MLNTTLCYIKYEDKVLMLHRTKKEEDPNEGKWIGIGGKFLENESPEECMLREVYEETGLTLESWSYRGIVTFVSDKWEGEYMHLFTALAKTDDVIECNEGELCWIEEKNLSQLNMWEGDKVFLKLLEDEEPFFSLKLVYKGEKIQDIILNGNQGK